jgi:hypothetical protein
VTRSRRYGRRGGREQRECFYEKASGLKVLRSDRGSAQGQGDNGNDRQTSFHLTFRARALTGQGTPTTPGVVKDRRQ